MDLNLSRKRRMLRRRQQESAFSLSRANNKRKDNPILREMREKRRSRGRPPKQPGARDDRASLEDDVDAPAEVDPSPAHGWVQESSDYSSPDSEMSDPLPEEEPCVNLGRNSSDEASVGRRACQLDTFRNQPFDPTNPSWPFAGPNSVKFFLWYAQSGISDSCLRELLKILPSLNVIGLQTELGGKLSAERIKKLWDLFPVHTPEIVNVDKLKTWKNKRTGEKRVVKRKCALRYFSLLELAERFVRNPTLQQFCSWGIKRRTDGIVQDWAETRMNREFLLLTDPKVFHVDKAEYRVGESVKFAIDDELKIGRIEAIRYVLRARSKIHSINKLSCTYIGPDDGFHTPKC